MHFCPFLSDDCSLYILSLSLSVKESGNEQQIKMQIVSSRGHDEDPPSNLLKSGRKDCYCSLEGAAPNEDWIVFGVLQKSAFSPSSIVIRNIEDLSGIKDISILGGSNEKQFEQWLTIKNIKKNEQRQSFPINPESAKMAQSKQWQYFKLLITANHGDEECNIFYEFALFGTNGVFAVYWSISCHSPSLCLPLSDLLFVSTHFPDIQMTALCT